MEREAQARCQKYRYFRNKAFQIFSALMKHHEIIRVPDVVPHFQGSLYEVIERIHVDIHEQLARQVADWKTDANASIRTKATHNLPQQPENIGIFDVLSQYPHQNVVVNAREERANITLQNPRRPRVVPGNFPPKIPESVDCAMHALALPTGE